MERERLRGLLARDGPAGGIAGLLGTVACVGAMALAAAGALGVGAAGVGASAGMAGMGAPGSAAGGVPAGILASLVRAGPAILVVSVVGLALSFAARSRVAVLPALLSGGVLSWGMYGQGRLSIMDAAIALGLAGWLAVYLRVRRRPTNAVPRAAGLTDTRRADARQQPDEPED